MLLIRQKLCTLLYVYPCPMASSWWVNEYVTWFSCMPLPQWCNDGLFKRVGKLKKSVIFPAQKAKKAYIGNEKSSSRIGLGDRIILQNAVEFLNIGG